VDQDEVPELRIVNDQLWQRVKLRQAELAKQLSGLLTCGCCGGKYGIVVNDRLWLSRSFPQGHL